MLCIIIYRERKTIEAILEDSNIQIQQEDPKRLKIFMVQAKGLFICSKCSEKWSSHRTTLVVHLYHKCIKKKYRQKCKRCMIWITPYFTEKQLNKIMKRVIKKYQKRKTDDVEYSTVLISYGTKGHSSSVPHETKLCERCQELGRSCWQRAAK